MSSSRIYLHYLQDIAENMDKAISFVQGMSEEQFLQDDKTTFATMICLCYFLNSGKSSLMKHRKIESQSSPLLVKLPKSF